MVAMMVTNSLELGVVPPPPPITCKIILQGYVEEKLMKCLPFACTSLVDLVDVDVLCS
jgi:hypothetical protein